MGIYTGTVPTLLAGEIASATKLLEITNFMTAETAVWSTAVPGWAASAGVPAIGNGTLTGRYKRMGKTVDFINHLTAGATTTYGTAGALFFFSLPGGGTAADTFMGSGWFFDTSAGANYPLIWKMDSGATTMRLWRVDATPAAELLNNAPVAMATGDQIMMSGRVEIT